MKFHAYAKKISRGYVDKFKMRLEIDQYISIEGKFYVDSEFEVKMEFRLRVQISKNCVGGFKNFRFHLYPYVMQINWKSI